MKWVQTCLNVHRASKIINESIYRCRISDTGVCAILIIEKDDNIIERSEHESVNEAKYAAERYLYNIMHNK